MTSQVGRKKSHEIVLRAKPSEPMGVEMMGQKHIRLCGSIQDNWLGSTYAQAGIWRIRPGLLVGSTPYK